MRWTCANCEREAGKLEQAFEHKGSIVCAECYQRLSEASVLARPGMAHTTAPASRSKTVCPRLMKTIVACGLAVLVGAVMCNAGEGSPITMAGIVLLAGPGLLMSILLMVLPYEIAKARNHHNATVIGVLCILGLFTGICWIIALIMAVWNSPRADGTSPAGA